MIYPLISSKSADDRFIDSGCSADKRIADLLKDLKGEVISLTGRIKNVRWEDGTAKVELSAGAGKSGGVTCIIRKHSASVQIIKDADYAKEIFLIGKLEGGGGFQLPGSAERFAIVLLSDCEVLPLAQ